MSPRNTIKLLISKSKAYKFGYDRAVAQKDYADAAQWRAGYYRIKERVDELKKEL